MYVTRTTMRLKFSDYCVLFEYSLHVSRAVSTFS